MYKKISLRRRLLVMVLAIWLVPVLIIYAFLTISYRNDIIDRTTVLMQESIKNFTYFNAQRISEAIVISKKTSYERIIERAWSDYKKDYINKSDLYRIITGNLTSKYYNDSRFEIAVFYLTNDLDNIYYTKQKESNHLEIYKNEVAKEAHLISSLDNSDAHVKIINGRIYIIRNLYTTTNYTKFGTLVLELNKSKLMDGISVNRDYEVAFYINDTTSNIMFDKRLEDEKQSGIIELLSRDYSLGANRIIKQESYHSYTGFIYQQKYSDFHLGAILVADKNVIYSNLKKLYIVMFTIMVIVIPVFIYMIYFISHHIRKPMSRMISASKSLELGDIGTQIEGDMMPNVEFDVLQNSFNKMSSEIKYLFDYAYQEKLARKDAKIIALQSQINPHFLNNTLEMMNWQARMAGDVAVSKMIEALGTLLNYSMDRSNKKLIPLSDELRCVDAYFYIISMRFGKRLKVEKEVDESLLQLQVPQLILQPLIENAVVHGVETIKSGTIQVKIYREVEEAVLQIQNTGKPMAESDCKRVNDILNGTYQRTEDEKDKHESLGIFNVNQRIKLIYGDNYGLTIEPIEGDMTVSTIRIPFRDNPFENETVLPKENPRML